MHATKSILRFAALVALWLGAHSSVFALSGDLQGLNKVNATNWGPASAWSSGNLQGWQELDYIVCRVVLSGSPRSNQPVEIDFPKLKNGIPGFQNVYFISNSPNLFFNSMPVADSPFPTSDGQYTMSVTITNSQTGYIYFYARLAAGAHLNVGSSLQLSGEPALSPLQIHKPDAGPGSPDLAILKTGPAFAGPGDLISYTITYTNKATLSQNTAHGVQLCDVLPSLVTFVGASGGGTNEPGLLTWDLPTLPPGASGFVTYQARVVTNAFNGQVFTNNAHIYEAEDDAYPADNHSSVKTTVLASRPPVANPDDYTVNEDELLTVPVAGVLANDTDPDPGTTLTAVLVSGVSHGTLNLNANGSFTYQPATNFNGVDQFTYQASDGSNFSAIVAATITVFPSNDPPVAVNDSYTMAEDTVLPVSAPGVLANDSDVDGDTLATMLVTSPAHGSLALQSTGAFLYTPDSNYTGTDSFSYRATDGALTSGVAVVTITITNVNDAPVAVDDAYTMAEDTLLIITAPGVLGNDTDLDGNPLSAVPVSNPSHGTLALNANGSFNYRPATNYTGVDSFTYRASDGAAASGVATVTITITNINDAPVAVDDAYVMAEDSLLTIGAPGVLGNDFDADGNALASVLVGNPAHGVLSLNADGSFTYQPGTNYHGTDSFTYRATDGALTSAVATVTITITNVNDVPVANDDAYTMAEDTLLTIAAPGVLGNDLDVDGEALSAAIVSNPAHGTLTLNSNGSFAYQPATDYHGTDSFTYRATDGALTSAVATVTITITNVNDVPVANGDAYTMAEDTLLTIPAPGVLANDTDADGNVLSAVLVTDPAHGTLALGANGSFTYRPATNYTGLDTFTYKASDGTATSGVATVTITITNINDAPVAVDDAYTMGEDTLLTIAAPGVLGNDLDVDGDPLSAVFVTNPTHGVLMLNADGSFIYQPVTNYTGLDSFSYKASDGAATSGVATVTITITNLNDAPVAVDDAYTMAEDTLLTLAAPGVLGNDLDVDGNPLSAVFVTNPVHGTLTLNADGSFNYRPATNYTGLDSFTYKASDGAATSGVATVTITITNVNDVPVANNDAYTMAEDTLLFIAAPGVLGNDSDVDGDALSAAIDSLPSHGSVTLNANGSFNYLPATNYTGLDSFTYRASDGALTSAVATVTITITNLNDAPAAVNDAYTMAEDTLLTIAAPGVLANDIDVDGNPLSAVFVTNPVHGALTLNADGSFSYLPATNYIGLDTFTYKASDGSATSAVATVTITITNVNDAPLANNDAYTMAEDTLLTIAAPGVLGNDLDVDGDQLGAVFVTNPAHGALTFNANGSFSYLPATNYTGLDTFTYKAADGTATSGVATVTITITNINDAPAAIDDAYTMAEDTLLTVAAPGVLGNDLDVDGNPLSAVFLSNPAHGSLTLNANGLFTYQPATNYHGLDSFTYKASDGTATSGVATVTITITNINDAPVALNDAYATAEDTLLTITAPGVLANDADVDGDPLSAVLVSNPAHGVVTLNANGSFSYLPATNYTGPDVFTYKANDGAATSGVATVTITITNVNDAPVALDDAYTMAEDTLLTIAAPGVLGNDLDVDGNPLSAVFVTNPAHGALTLNANGSFNYLPATNYTGLDTFTYKATDGTATSSVATVTIAITNINDAPVAIDDAYTMAEDTLLTIAAPGVLGNDFDVDGNPLSAVFVTNPAHGALSLNANGSFSYLPATNYTGLDTFTYKATDGTATSGVATVTITITNITDAPVAIDDAYTMAEDTLLTIAAPGVLGNDLDVDGNALTPLLVANPSHGAVTLNPDGSFNYRPATNYHGLDTFTYKATDGSATSGVATVTITITNLNDAPVAANDAYTMAEDTSLVVSVPGVLGNDSDVDGDVLSAVIALQPAHGAVTLMANGSFTYTPATNYTGLDTFTYRATDGALTSAVATVTITITNVNDAPVANNDAYTMAEDTLLNIAAPGVLINDMDVDGDPLNAVLVSDPAHGVVTLNANGSFSYRPATNYTGSDVFTYKASDGSATSGVATVTITITNVNDAPVAIDDAYTTAEDTLLSIAAPGVLTNDVDVDGNPLSAVFVTNPAHGALILNANGSFSYLPATNYTGLDTFTYKATDGTATSGVATVTITITNVNDAPVANSDAYTMAEDTLLTIVPPGVLGNDLDVDGDPLSAVFVTNPAHGALTLNANGSFSYLPATNYTGLDTFTYKATDGSATSGVATVTITITNINDAPVAIDDAYTMAEDTLLTVAVPGVLGNDLDVDGDPLSAVFVTNPAHGALTLNANGSFSYQPATNYAGLDTFTYRASDGSTTSGVATVTITITNINDAPVAVDDAYTMAEDTLLTIVAPGVLGNDLDVDGNPLSAIFVTNPAHGILVLNATGLFVYQPATNYTGLDAFTYRASDGSATSGVATVRITITNINDAPVAINDAYAMAEDTLLTVASPGVLGNDLDVDGNPLSAVFVTNPAHGALTLNANGSFSYQPATNYIGLDTFTYKASDGTATSGVATVTITITNINDAPVAADDAYTMAEDTLLTIPAPGVLGNDLDVDGDSLSTVLVGNPTHGVLALNADGSFSYQPATNFHGIDTFTYKASDGGARSGVATVTITITNINDAPVAANDAYEMAEDTLLTIDLPGVLGNDSDVDGNPLSAVLVSNPAHGVLVFQAAGSFTYQPGTNFHGLDTFTYKASDGSATSGVATVTITVTNVNDAPVAIDDAYVTAEDTQLIVPALGVLDNDYDVDGHPLSALLVSGPAHGVLKLNVSGSFSYLPDTNYHGLDSFTYRATDDFATSGVATVSLTITNVNDVPVVVDDAYTMAEDSLLLMGAPGVLVNDFDVDGDGLNAIMVTNPSHGTLTLNLDGSFSYQPATNYHGLDVFTYRASDGSTTSGVATVTITITNINDAPVAVDDAYAMAEDDLLIIPAPGVLINDFDADGDALTALTVDEPAHGVLKLHFDGLFSYQPDTNYTGIDTFTYVVTDGSATSGVATVTITITNVNDAPVAVDDAYTMAENTLLIIPAAGVLTNDLDADGDALTALLASEPVHGVVTLNINGSFNYRPATNYHGFDTFTYRATDGTATSDVATVTITITNLNDTPIAADDAYTMAEDTLLSIAVPGVLANDTDVDGDVLSAVFATNPSHGTLTLDANGSFNYRPATNYTGLDTFTYRATDGTATSGVATVVITITNINDAPVALDDAYSIVEDTVLNIAAPGVLVNDLDVDGNTLNAALASNPAHGALTLNANGSFSYRPATNYNGLDTFTYRASDGIATSGVATVTITITPVNDAPVANDDAYTMLEDTVLTIAAPGVLGNDFDVDGNAIKSVLVGNPAHGVVTLSTNGSFVYVPATNYNGTDTFTYKVSNSLLESGVATVTINITPVNNPPVVSIVNPTNGSTFLSPAHFTVVADAADLDGVVANVQVFRGTNLIGTFTNAPYFVTLTNLGFGTYTFYATATDDGGLRATSSVVSVTVTTTPPITALGPIALNRSNGLFEQFVRISNPTPEDFPNGMRLFVDLGIDTTNKVWNATGTNAMGVRYIDTPTPLLSGGHLDVLVQYYVPSTRTIPNAVVTAQPLPFMAPVAPRPQITKVTATPSGATVNFTTVDHGLYFLQCSEDLVHWTTIPGLMHGTGGGVQCQDPAPVAKRFYRVIKLP